MTATPQQLVCRELEHCRCRCSSRHIKPTRRLQLFVVAAPDADPADFPGFTREQIAAGLTTPVLADGGRR